MAEKDKRPPLAIHLALQCLLDAAGLNGVAQESLCVALSRHSARAQLPIPGVRMHFPAVMVSHAVLVALRP